MRPAAQIYYAAAGRVLLIETYDDWSAKAVANVFDDWFLTTLSSPPRKEPDAIIRIQCGKPPLVPSTLSNFEITDGGRCFTDSENYWLELDDSVIFFGPASRPEVELWVGKPYQIPSSLVVQLLSQALSPALRRSGLFEIHSAALVSPSDRMAIMIAGPSGSGKSTLTSQLARCGWGYISDDILLLGQKGKKVEVQAFRRYFALTSITLAAVDMVDADNSEVSAHLKTRVVPQDQFDAPRFQFAEPRIIIFPIITGEARSSFTGLTQMQTMTYLLRLCPWATYDRVTAQEHVTLLGKLAGSTTAYQLLAGTDILSNPKVADDLLGRLIDQNC